MESGTPRPVFLSPPIGVAGVKQRTLPQMIRSKPNPQAPNEGEKRKQLAKQGNARAIAALMNRWLQPKGITAAARREDSCLQLTVEAERVPNQTVLVTFIRKVLASVEVVSIQTVKISVHLTGESESVWQEEIQLTPRSEAPEATEVAMPKARRNAYAPFSVSSETASSESALSALEETPSIAIAAEEIVSPIAEERPRIVDFVSDEMPPQEISSSPQERLEIVAPIAEERQGVVEFVSDEMPPQEISYSPHERLEIVEFSDDEMPLKETSSSENAEPASHEEMDVVAQPKLLSWLSTPQGKRLAILWLALVVLGIVGINSYLQRFSPTQPIPTPTTEPNPGAKAPEPLPPGNPFKEAVEEAIATAKKTQIAQSKEDWQVVASQWRSAIANMQAVPQSSPNYQLAQQKVGEYQRNLDYALQKAASSR